jgi:small subunit ribosomal protein S2
MALGGIREMGGLPDILFVIDTNKEAIAIQEARRLNIPVVAVLDSNSDPEGVAYPIPGNDDALRAIGIYCELISGAVLDGLQAEMTSAGIDLGASAEVPVEDFDADIIAGTPSEVLDETITVAASVAEPMVEANDLAVEAAPEESVESAEGSKTREQVEKKEQEKDTDNV